MLSKKILFWLILLLAVVGGAYTNVYGWCMKDDFSNDPGGPGTPCDTAPYSPIYEERWCIPWIDSLYGSPFIKYAAYINQYDCNGNLRVCQPTCPVNLCAYDTMDECQATCGTRIVCEDEYYLGCEFSGGGGGSFPPPDCPKGQQCCIGGGGSNGGGPGSTGGGNGGGGFGGYVLSLIKLIPKSPAPDFEIRYNNKYLLDRGLGKGWSHTYMLTLTEHSSGNVTITGETGFRWVYLSNGDDTFESAPYDHSTLVKQGNNYISTLKDGTKYTYATYNQDGVILGRLASIVDLNNNSLTMTYYGDGSLQTVADSSGRALNFTYENNHLETVTDPNNNQYTFEYDTNDNLISITYPDSTTRQFQYNEPDRPHNLNRVIDNNNNTLATYAYDDKGRIISKSGPGDTNSVNIAYSPGVEVFSDDFYNDIKSDWSKTGTVDHMTYNGENVARLHPGTMTYTKPSGGVPVLKLTFDLWVDTSNNADFYVKIYDSMQPQEPKDDYGAVVKFASAGTVYSEYFNNASGTTITELIKNRLDTDTRKWHKVEIEADARIYHDYRYFKIWIDCEYIGAFLFKRSAAALNLDTIKIQAGAANSYIYIDNVAIDEIRSDDSMVVTTDSQGNQEVVTVTSNNEFNGETWQTVKSGKIDNGCGSCGPTNTQTEFDGQWNIRRTIDANDVMTEMTYDERGNMLTKTEAKGTSLERTTTYTYHPTFNKIATITEPSVDPQGQNKVTTYTYDNTTGNLLTETVQGYSRGSSFVYTTAYQYNSHGQMIQEDGPRTDVNDITTYSYHQASGYLTAITSPNGTVTYSGYDANHNVGSITDLNGVATNYTYDYAGRVKTITTGSAVTLYEYDPAGNIDSVTMPEGNTINYDYDSTNRMIKITDQLGNYISYAYDSSGNKTREEIHDPQSALKKYLDFEYNNFSRLSRITNPDNSYSAFTYDNNGNRIGMDTKAMPEDIITTYEYDELNRLKKVTQAEGTTSAAVTEYQYDRKDNLTQVKDATNKITAYKYDDMARLVETTSPDTGTTIYTYDAAGNLISKTDAKSITVTYTYDALNRLTKTNFPADPDIVYTYDEQDVSNGKGRLTTLANTASSQRYYYDERGNITEVRCTIDPGTCGAITYTTEYTYNDNNELLSITYPSGRVINYDRNVIGNITSVDLSINQTPQTIADAFSYEPFGSVKGLSYANSIQTAITHNNKYQISSIQAGTVVNRTYTHDFEGNISSVKPLDTLPQPTLTASTAIYSYISGKDWIQQITNGSTYNYTHDNNGNITADGIRTYVYNQDNRLTQVTKAGITGQYTYNGNGQRIKKVTGGNTTIYHYDLQGNLIEETGGDGTLIVSYVYAGDNRIAQVPANNNIYYYHNDHLGTPLAVTNGTGSIVWKAAYNTFGNAVVDGGSTITNNFRFPGQYYDAESRLHYNWHRYYDPRTGRYVTADPIGIEGGINLFAYVKNNPIINVDLDGTKLIVYGDYCGPGSRIPTGKASDPPVPNCVDEACRQHDICYNKIKWWLPILVQPRKLKCDRILCKDTRKCKTTCQNIAIKTGVNTYFLCLLIAPPGL